MELLKEIRPPPEVPSFASKIVCAKCGGRGNKIDARPNSNTQ